MTFATISRLAVLLALGTGCSFTAARGRAEDRATGDPLAGSSVVSGKLSNGFSYYVIRNADPSDRLSLRLLVKTGAVQEDDDQGGAAHFVEHLAFAGTQNFKRNDINSFIRSLGINWGADVNAESRLDSTQYRLAVSHRLVRCLRQGIRVPARRRRESSTPKRRLGVAPGRTGPSVMMPVERS